MLSQEAVMKSWGFSHLFFGRFWGLTPEAQSNSRSTRSLALFHVPGFAEPILFVEGLAPKAILRFANGTVVIRPSIEQ